MIFRYFITLTKYISLFSLVFQSFVLAQQVSWQKNIKSNTQDFLSQLSITLDGQYLLSGSSIQKAPQISNNPNLGYDFHLVKMNQQGQIIWDRYFGGNKHDFLTATTATQEGGFLLAGTSYSDEGFQKKSQSKGGSDVWIIKIDEHGEEQWQKTLGTIAEEEAKSIIQTNDLGYLMAGNIQNKEGGFGSKDVWLVKLDKTGKVFYQLFLGGTGLDEVEKIIPTRDGGALVGIYSRSAKMENFTSKTAKEKSIDGDQSSFQSKNSFKEKNTPLLVTTTYESKNTESYGEGDFWVVKINKNGKVEWQKSFGGKEDDHIRTLVSTDQGFVIAGESRSGNSGNKKPSIKEGTDLWVVSLDDQGEELWQKGFNFNNREVLMSLNAIHDISGTTTKGFLLGGYTQAEGKVEQHDETFWMLYLNSKGEEVWRKYVEGTDKQNEERLIDAKLNSDGSYILVGTSATELGKENWKVVKLLDQQIDLLIEKQDLRVYPNPVEDYCYVEIGIDFREAIIGIYDLSGLLAYQTKTKNKTTKINTNNLPQGIYVISINTENKKLNSKIIKK